MLLHYYPLPGLVSEQPQDVLSLLSFILIFSFLDQPYNSKPGYISPFSFPFLPNPCTRNIQSRAREQSVKLHFTFYQKRDIVVFLFPKSVTSAIILYTNTFQIVPIETNTAHRQSSLVCKQYLYRNRNMRSQSSLVRKQYLDRNINMRLIRVFGFYSSLFLFRLWNRMS